MAIILFSSRFPTHFRTHSAARSFSPSPRRFPINPEVPLENLLRFALLTYEFLHHSTWSSLFNLPAIPLLQRKSKHTELYVQLLYNYYYI